MQEFTPNADIVDIFSVINKAAGEVRIVGGFIRDLLRGIKAKDIDLATTLHPVDIIKAFTHSDFIIVDNAAKFGSITLIKNGTKYEITTLRKDTNCNGRYADVTFSTAWEEDAQRRDFTMNALYMDINGNIYDYCSGTEDIKKERVVFIGDAAKRIQEDYLRILRYFRFCANLNIECDSKVVNIITDNVAGLNVLSKERITSEMLKIFTYSGCAKIFNIMNKCGVLKQVFNAYITEFNYLNKVVPFEDWRVAFFALMLDANCNISEQLAITARDRKNISIMWNNRNTITAKDFGLLQKEFIYDYSNLCEVFAISGNKNIAYNYAATVKKLPVGGEYAIAKGLQGAAIAKFLLMAKKAWIASDFTTFE
jgi:tRNA nucleotidyltransferase/poly(A) polymerase